MARGTRRVIDQPAETDDLEASWARQANARLGLLATGLRGQRFQVKETDHAVRVSVPIPGCCGLDRADTITCKPRDDDGDRLWYFTSWGEPIAEADPSKISFAIAWIKGYLKASP